MLSFVLPLFCAKFVRQEVSERVDIFRVRRPSFSSGRGVLSYSFSEFRAFFSSWTHTKREEACTSSRLNQFIVPRFVQKSGRFYVWVFVDGTSTWPFSGRIRLGFVFL